MVKELREGCCTWSVERKGKVMGSEAGEVARTHHAGHIGHAEQEVDISRFYVAGERLAPIRI